MVWKMENVKINQFFEFSNTGYILRGHDKKLEINRDSTQENFSLATE